MLRRRNRASRKPGDGYSGAFSGVSFGRSSGFGISIISGEGLAAVSSPVAGSRTPDPHPTIPIIMAQNTSRLRTIRIAQPFVVHSG